MFKQFNIGKEGHPLLQTHLSPERGAAGAKVFREDQLLLPLRVHHHRILHHHQQLDFYRSGFEHVLLAIIKPWHIPNIRICIKFQFSNISPGPCDALLPNEQLTDQQALPRMLSVPALTRRLEMRGISFGGNFVAR